MASPKVWQPDWAVSPGEVLAEELENRGLSQSDLARRMDRPIKTINEIVHGKAAITPETAWQLELALGISSAMWLGLETTYRGHLARSRAIEEFEQHVDWALAFPLADLRRHDVLDTTGKTGGDLVAAVLGFFGVSSVRAWQQQWGHAVAAYRRSPSFDADPVTLATWLRWGERRAMEIDCAPFDRACVREVLHRIGALTREEPFDDVLQDLREDLAGCGVALVLTPELKGTHVSGAARWVTADKAIVQLSLRHKRDDQFWFSLSHELAHLLDRGRKERVDGAGLEQDVDAEQRANQRARDALIPPNAYRELLTEGDLDEAAIRRFAAEVNVAPGIVVGRLQHDDHLPHNHRLNALKRSLGWRAD
jgi:addiction module HigA family antidote